MKKDDLLNKDSALQQGGTSNKAFTLKRKSGYWLGEFTVMASPCQILLDNLDETQAGSLTEQAYAEAKRIELKYSRFRDDNIIADLNSSADETISVDEETTRLINLADLCFQLSGGLFDMLWLNESVYRNGIEYSQHKNGVHNDKSTSNIFSSIQA